MAPGRTGHAARPLVQGPGVPRDELARAADEGGARRGHGRHPRRGDLEGLPRDLAQLRGDRTGRAATCAGTTCPAASSSSAPDGEPTGLIREESAWRFKEDHLEHSDAEYLDALREGLKVAASRGVTCDPRQGRLDPGDPAPLAGARARRGAPGPRLAVGAARERRPPRASSGSRRPRRAAARRLPEGLHGRHARLADGADDRRHRRRDHHSRGARGHPPPRRARPAGRSPCTRSATSRTGTRSTRSRRRRSTGSRSACATASSTRSAWRRRTCRGSPSSGRRRRCSSRHAPSDEELAERFWAGRLDGAYAFRALLDAGTVIQRLGRADRGARPVGGDRRRRAPPLARGAAVTVEEALRRHDASRRRG